MNQILTDEEIEAIENLERSDWLWSYTRAIESAVLAKLREQEPVGYVGKVMPRGEGVLIRTTAYDMQEDDELYLHPAPSAPDAFPQAHRLALELECLILDCKDNVVVSRWRDSANEALEQWREFCAENAMLAAARSGE